MGVPIPIQDTQEIDPFYINLFDGGKFFYSQGNFTESVENFKVASFGFLDSPQLLLECYIYLTLCHYFLNDVSSSQHYFEEIKRLGLEQDIENINLPKNLHDKYNEISSYFARMAPRPEPAQTKTTPKKTQTSTQSITTPSPAQLKTVEINRLKEEIKTNEKDPVPYFQLSALYLEQNNIPKAKSTLKKLLGIDAKNGSAHFELGKITLKEKKTKTALKHFQEAAVLLPGNAEVLYQLAATYYNLKKLKEAKQEFLKVQEISKEYKDTPTYLASLGEISLAESQDNDQAGYLDLARQSETLPKKMMYYRQALKLDSSNVDIYFEMARIYKDNKKYDEAAEIYVMLIDHSPNNIQIYTELGDVYLLDRSYEEALNLLTVAKARAPQNIEVRYLLGKTYLKKKQYPEAAAELHFVLNQDPAYKDAPKLWQTCSKKMKKQTLDSRL